MFELNVMFRTFDPLDYLWRRRISFWLCAMYNIVLKFLCNVLPLKCHIRYAQILVSIWRFIYNFCTILKTYVPWLLYDSISHYSRYIWHEDSHYTSQYYIHIVILFYWPTNADCYNLINNWFFITHPKK